jgi:hypothetical protein
MKLKHVLITLTGLALCGLTLAAISAIFIFSSLFFAGSKPDDLASSINSPSGLLEAKTELSGPEAGSTRHHCVILKVINIQTKKEAKLQTGASDFQRWAIGWAPGDTLILYSSDIGTYAYDLQDNALVERPITKEEMEVGKDAYQKKYGNRPRF